MRFGGERSDLDERGRRDIVAVGARVADESSAPIRVCSGPETSVLTSARLLTDRARADGIRLDGVHVGGVHRGVHPEGIRLDGDLRSLDVGRWAGRRPDELPAADLGAWFADVTACPHGGESVAAFVARIHHRFGDLAREHADARDVSLVVVAAMPVVQALLTDDPAEFFAHEVRPASVHRLPVP